MSTSMNDLLYPKASPALLAQMQQDRQNELKAKAEFEAEKARLKTANLVENSKPESVGVNNSIAAQSDDKKELEEMTIAEIGAEIPKIPVSNGQNTIADVFKGSMKINQIVNYWNAYKGTILHCVLDSIVDLLVERRGKDCPEFNILQEYALKIIQTAHCTHKKGYDINVGLDVEGHKLSKIPLRNIVFAWRRFKECSTSRVIDIVKALISAGANVGTFDLCLMPPQLRNNQFNLLTKYNNISQYTTPVDELMHLYHKNQHFLDFYSMSEWEPTQEIPSDFNDPLFRLILKTIYQQSALVFDFPTISINSLKEYFEKPERQKTNVFPNTVNALIFSYAKPKFEIAKALSCLQRSRTFYQNILYIGRQFCIEDQEKEAELLALQHRQPAKVRI